MKKLIVIAAIVVLIAIRLTPQRLAAKKLALSS